VEPNSKLALMKVRAVSRTPPFQFVVIDDNPFFCQQQVLLPFNDLS
jgi:hypothetical protein